MYGSGGGSREAADGMSAVRPLQPGLSSGADTTDDGCCRRKEEL